MQIKPVKMLSLKIPMINFLYVTKVTSGNAMSMSNVQRKMKTPKGFCRLQVNIHPQNSGARKIFTQTSGLDN